MLSNAFLALYSISGLINLLLKLKKVLQEQLHLAPNEVDPLPELQWEIEKEHDQQTFLFALHRAFLIDFVSFSD